MRYYLLILVLVGLLVACAPSSDAGDLTTSESLFVEPAIAAEQFITVTPKRATETVTLDTPSLTPMPSLTVIPPTETAQPTSTPAPEQPIAPTAPPTEPPTLTPSPSPTREAREATSTPVVRQLMTGDCCVNPVWRADSMGVYFIDKPAVNAPNGIYQVGINSSAPQPAGELVTTLLGNWQVEGRFYLIPNGEAVSITDMTTNQSWQINTEGEQLSISPDATLVTWQVREENPDLSFDEREGIIWVANLDGSQARVVLRSRGAQFVGWLNNNSMMLQDRENSDPRERMWLRYDPTTDSSTPLIRDTRIRDISISPDGTYLAYMISLEQDEPQRNGFWLTNSQTGETWQLPFVGAYRWRNATKLMFIPMELGTQSHRLQEYDVTSRTIHDLTNPASHPFRVTNNDWAVSPDGTKVVFVSAEDGNLWLIDLGN